MIEQHSSLLCSCHEFEDLPSLYTSFYFVDYFCFLIYLFVHFSKNCFCSSRTLALLQASMKPFGYTQGNRRKRRGHFSVSSCPFLVAYAHLYDLHLSVFHLISQRDASTFLLLWVQSHMLKPEILHFFPSIHLNQLPFLQYVDSVSIYEVTKTITKAAFRAKGPEHLWLWH